MISFRRFAVLAAAFAAIGASPGALAQGKVLRVVTHSNLSILDPIWTTAYMSRNHGYMIYDTLFGTDAKARVKPQMVDTWTMSKDGKTWSFKLRKGLAFHDGAPVTSEDVVASLKRWGRRDALGQQLMTFVDAMETPAPDTFVLKLKEPCGFVLEALGKPSSNVPFIMPKRVAETDPFKQIDDYTGSGPYIFKKDEFKPGDKAVYVKNTKYVPRKEPASGTTGGKRVYVDRVEFNLALRDPQSQVNALAKGEVDILERPAFESYGQLKEIKGVEIVNRDPMGFQYMCRFNALHPPFDKAAVRRAALAAFRQEAFLQAQVGVKEYYHSCASMFTCNTPYATTAGSEIMAKSNMRKARELLKASGYDGTPVVLMKPTDLAAIQKLPDVAAQLMRQAGFKVDLQAMDWQTLVSRRAKKDPPSQGGWNMFCTAWVAPDIWSPLSNAALDTKGEKASWFGWPDDPKIEQLKAQFARELDLGKRKKLAAEIQAEAFAFGTHAPLGEYINPVALRKGITGLVIGPGDFYWNVKKN
jgi:peptide/nickel transport system substrate-binding protein